MSDSFLPSLDFVLAALKLRSGAGASLKASTHSLVGLQSAARVQRSQASKPAPRPQDVSQPLPSVPSAPEPAVPSVIVPPITRPVPSRVVGGDKGARIEALRAEVLACQLCPNLVQSRSTVVFGEGNVDAELMLIGEAPGEEEDLCGEPFVGAVGDLLNKILTAMGTSRDAVYIANVLKCRPDVPIGASGNRKPTPAEMGRCLPYLHQQIAIVQPRVIVALGASAMQGLFGKTEPMARLRSHWYAIQDIPVMATYHPTYLLRNQALSEKRKVWEDLLQVLERLERPISAKQRGFFLKTSA